MHSDLRRPLISCGLALAFLAPGKTQTRAPVIWDDAALADWAAPIAALQVRPAHYKPADYYAVPAQNLRTYPVYLPGKEPPGYWESLQKKRPEPLVDVSTIRTESDWIEAGARAFRELDNPFSRTDDPALIAAMRDPRTFAGIGGLADGTVLDHRWVVTDRGVLLTIWECSGCHARMGADKTVEYALPLASRPPGLAPGGVERLLVQQFMLSSERTYGTADPADLFTRMFAVPWAPGEAERLQRFLTRPEDAVAAGFNPHGVIARVNGSPFYGTRVPDLHLLRYNKYIDATGTHQLRGPEDIARYAAIINSADPMDFGTHRFLSDTQRRVAYRFADEVLYAIGVYLLSLEPPRNPSPPPADLVARGQAIFRREECETCHPAPAYTTGKLTLADGYEPPRDHPFRARYPPRVDRHRPGPRAQDAQGHRVLQDPVAARLVVPAASPARRVDRLARRAVRRRTAPRRLRAKGLEPAGSDQGTDSGPGVPDETAGRGQEGTDCVPAKPLIRDSSERSADAETRKMVRPTRFERVTYRFVVCCSIQLS
jgi:hypothetical protein